jgi:hypothetical protein
VLVLPSNIAAKRKVVAARLTTLRVRELSTRCPLILLLGLNPSQETKAFSLRHFAMLVPISLTRVKIARTFKPVRGKLFLWTSKASWMAFGTFCRLGVAANLVDSASETLTLPKNRRSLH